jgi:hypothetical protein
LAALNDEKESNISEGIEMVMDLGGSASRAS